MMIAIKLKNLINVQHSFSRKTVIKLTKNYAKNFSVIINRYFSDSTSWWGFEIMPWQLSAHGCWKLLVWEGYSFYFFRIQGELVFENITILPSHAIHSTTTKDCWTKALANPLHKKKNREFESASMFAMVGKLSLHLIFSDSNQTSSYDTFARKSIEEKGKKNLAQKFK